MRAFLARRPYTRLLRDIRTDPGKWASRLVLLLGPWAAFVMVEFLNENDLVEDFQPWQVLMNLIWYYILFVALRLVLGRRRRAGAAAALLSFAVGLVNHYVLRFRGRILFPADIPAWRTAANVADGFDFSPDLYIQQAVIVLVVYLFLVCVCPAQKKREPMPRLAAVLLSGSMAAYIFVFFFTGALPALGVYTQQWVTQGNGFLLNFTVALRYSVVERPQGYSRQASNDLMEQFAPIEGNDEVTRPVNLIVIMNESFGDLTIFGDLETSSDPTPFLHSLRTDTIKGWMYSPVTGGGTASVEFEYLTGFSNRFLPPHTVAYQLYMKRDMPSFTAFLKELEYGATAFHPYRASGWNRPVVYDYLGFDEQLYEEDVEDPWYIRYYISDRSSYEKVEEITAAAEGEPCFVFNVTMQGHSGYAQGWNNLGLTVTVSEELHEADETAQQYFSLARASDTALQQLIEHYRRVEEPTMIVFFGDHQPALTNAFYEVLYGKPLRERTAEELLQQYAVPFFIWANYDIPEQEDVIISPNYLGMLTAKTAGLPLTGWMRFLDQMYEELPVITPVGFITGEGEAVRTVSELNEEQQEWLRQYEILCYRGLMDLTDEARPFYRLGP